jgi:hypothetical protein
MVEVRWGFREDSLRSLENTLIEFLSSIMRNGQWLVVSYVFGDEQPLLGIRKGDVLLFDLGVNHSCFELIVYGSVGWYALII